MFLGTTLSAASSGLDSIEKQFAVLSQNVANASTPNYVEETVPLSSLDTAAGPSGVRTGQATRTVDLQLQANVFAAASKEAGSNVISAALSGIDAASGAPGKGQDLASIVGALQDSFSTLGNDPSNTSQQTDVLGKAGAVVGSLNTLSDTITTARQKSQDTLQSDVATANDALKALGALSKQIVAAKSTGQSTAGLEDQRDGAMRSLAQLTGAKFVSESDGSVLAIAANSVLPLDASSGPFSLGTVNFTAGTPSASVPPLLLGGSPVSGLGGEMGANLTLRDSTLPGMQSKLDGFAQSLASSFQSQGLPLFTDGSGSVPSLPAGGFASTIQVSAAVQATPTMLRDGTGAMTSAGDTTLISNVLNNVFSSSSTGVGAQASGLVATFASQSASAGATATTNTALRTGLDSRLSSETGVSVDSELSHMVALQNAYGANAKVITAVENMWQQLLQAVQ